MFAAAFAAFITIFIAEFGDKTQLVSLAMACRYPPLKVLSGAMVALAAVLGLAVLVGGLIFTAIPHSVVVIISGAVFLIMGIANYLRRDDSAEECKDRNGFLHTMIMVFVAEFGDKTQLAALFLAASFGYPLAVFAGAMVAMFFNHLIAVYLGSRFISRINPKVLKVGTSMVFIIIGLLIIILESGLIG
ncbi:MAG: TMEM165/GDT1 family protein [Bacillota bacterium]|jgi:Ca2+/H+ antiporter, TMEM165/GDT1 family|nr:TMEM165/GDT1 family protein [Bacillota bacterium]